MKNSYEIRGEITSIFIDSPKYGRHETLISTEDLKRANDFPNSWCVVFSPKTKTFYVSGSLPRENGVQKNIQLHRWLTNPPEEMVIDHRNHDTLDNRRTNLKITTHAENNQNKPKPMSTNTSGIRGVYWHDRVGKWRAKITKNGITTYLGYFDSLEKAREARKKAEKELFSWAN
jgi:hypothetical protein